MLLVLTQLHRVFASDAKTLVQHAVPLPTSAALDTPEDLRDRRMSRNVDRHGYRSTGLLTPDDVGGGCDPVYFAMLAILPTLIILASMSGSALLGAAAMIAYYLEVSLQVDGEEGQKNSTGVNFLLLVVGIICVFFFVQGLAIVGVISACTFSIKYWNSRIEERNQLRQQDAVFAADTASNLVPIMQDAENARKEQNIVAVKDTTPMIAQGTSLGFLIRKGDIYAPDALLPMSSSIKDLATHLIVFGRTGTGKTACVMRPMMHQWIQRICGGALILDGKGSLPVEFYNAYPTRIKLIAPGKAKYNPIAGLTPEEVTIVLVETMNEGGDNDFWSRSAEQVIRNAGIVLEAAGKANKDDQRFKWKLTALGNIISNKNIQEAAIHAAKSLPEASRPGLLRAAISDLEVEFAALAAETRSGIVKTATSFIAPIVGHRDLYDWCDTDEGDMIEDVCQGDIYAISTPGSKYGNPGIAIQALAKARVYRAIKNRADYDWEKAGESRVMVMMDEFQKMCGSAEMNMLDIGRSLGLIAVAATQSVEAVDAAMGKADSRAMLANFVNCVCFNSTKETLTFVADEKMGYTVMRKEADMRGIDYLKMGKVADTGYSGQSQFMPTKEIVSGEYTLVASQVITAEELGAAVSQKFRAAVYLDRAGAPRRDIAVFTPGGVVNANPVVAPAPEIRKAAPIEVAQDAPSEMDFEIPPEEAFT